MNTVSVDREFLEHCLSVMRGVGELCQPIPRKSEDDPTEHCGGQALAELANCYNRLLETIAYAEQAALTQPEQRRTSALDIARAAGMPVQPQQPEQEYHRVFEANESLEESLAEQPEAGRDFKQGAKREPPIVTGQVRKIEPPVTIYRQRKANGSTGIYLEDQRSHLCECETDVDAWGIANALNATTRPQAQEANAEAVDLLRELAKDFEALAKKEELDPSRTAEEVDENWRETMLNLRAGIPAKFLAQHGGRDDG